MNVVYAQHESSNEYRSYPFAENVRLVDTDGAELATDIFVDALLCPIVHEARELYLQSLDFSNGEVTVGDGSVVLSGSGDERAGTIELYDAHGRHAGFLVCGEGWDRERGTMRRRSFEGVKFSSFVTSPVVYNGVESIVTPDGPRTTRRNIVLEGDDTLTPVVDRSGAGGYVLSFDAMYDPGVRDTNGAIRQIVFAAFGKTVFSVSEADEGEVILATPMLDREDVCWQAHREDAVSTVVDTCEPHEACPPKDVPYRSERVDVCPTEEGLVTIATDNAIGFRNPVHVSTISSPAAPNVPVIEDGMTEEGIVRQGEKLRARPVQIGNGVEISIPGVGLV